MKTLYSLALTLCLLAGSAFGQTNSLTQTTLSAAALVNDTVIAVTSATGISAPSASGVIGTELYVISPGMQRGEVMMVRGVSSTNITVTRGAQGMQAAIPNGATVLIGQPNYFRDFTASGGCTLASTFIAPHVNTKTGEQVLCSSITLSWVAGFNSPGIVTGVTTLVASAAGVILPSGPLFHVNGTAAITGFTIPVGFVSGSFTIIPDAVFTWTAAGNIALAGTAVVNKALTFTWDATNSKWIPSYIA